MKLDSDIPGSKLKWGRFFNRFSSGVTKATGRPLATIFAFLLVFLWGVAGPLFHFSTQWELFINTSTTIITFLMVFVIQQSQNRDTIAIHLKLNELIASSDKASNRLVDMDDLTEEELYILKNFYRELSDKAEKENDLHSSHSLDDADDNNSRKRARLRIPIEKKEIKQPV